MTEVTLEPRAYAQVEAIYEYSLLHWGEAQADSYLAGFSETIERIGSGSILSRPIPAEFGVDGQFCRYRSHFIYWRKRSDGNIGIVAVLHQRMHQLDRFREA